MLPPGSVPLVHPPLGDAQMLVLPHPHTGVPSYFALDDTHTALYELLVVRPDAPHARSWLVGHAESRGGAPGAVIGDGALRVLSPIDPVFVVLGLLADVDARHFRPLEDLAEAAAELHAQRRAQATPGGGAPRAWPDIVPFLSMPSIAAHLARICDTQAEAAADGLVYRLSWARVAEVLDAKRTRLAEPATCDAAPETLGRLVRKALPSAATASDDEVQRARVAVARDLVCAYIPPSVAARWEENV
ncbi:hypothetical protein MOBT1_002852 [Malassezia obtusa]|uniref:Ribonuclease H2 subunit B n=1 Tax=Malassezia obtusa TaxID=76774 RepID=A0AAF0E1Z8_9BASI|nr:hypothetical protein MOBT1_002852 [Malassezia obtusa]